MFGIKRINRRLDRLTISRAMHSASLSAHRNELTEQQLALEKLGRTVRQLEDEVFEMQLQENRREYNNEVDEVYDQETDRLVDAYDGSYDSYVIQFIDIGRPEDD